MELLTHLFFFFHFSLFLSLFFPFSPPNCSNLIQVGKFLPPSSATCPFLICSLPLSYPKLGFPFSRGVTHGLHGSPLRLPFYFFFYFFSPFDTFLNVSHGSLPFYYPCVICHMDTCIKWQLPHHMVLMPCAPLTSYHVAATWSCYVAPLFESPDTRYGDTSKNVKFQLSHNSTKFDWVIRFRKEIPMVKSVFSSGI